MFERIKTSLQAGLQKVESAWWPRQSEGAAEVRLEQLLILAEQGDIAAQRGLGDWFIAAVDVPDHERRAFFWYLKAALQGDALAQTALAQSYETGVGVGADQAQAFVWYRKAAQQGLASAQYALALIYLEDQGQDTSLQQAYIWLVRAAAQGWTLAIERLTALGWPLDGALADVSASLVTQSASDSSKNHDTLAQKTRPKSLALPVLHLSPSEDP